MEEHLDKKVDVHRKEATLAIEDFTELFPGAGNNFLYYGKSSSLRTKAGRHVGIISHVEELQERIPVQIQVIQEGNNSSSKVRIIPKTK